MPRDAAELWGFIAGLDQVSIMALFAHCASLTVNVVRQPWEDKRRAQATAEKLATALVLDMSQYWAPTIGAYLGRVTKAHILAAVRETLGDEAADRITGMKKQPMAEAAAQLLTGTGWLPPLMRTEPSKWLSIQRRRPTRSPNRKRTKPCHKMMRPPWKADISSTMPLSNPSGPEPFGSGLMPLFFINLRIEQAPRCIMYGNASLG